VNGPEPRPPGASLDLFGGPTLIDGGERVLRLTPTQQALVTLIWGHEQRGVGRRRAIWLLWEEEDAARPRHRLRQLLHDVRSRVGLDPETLGGEERLVADPRILRCDLADFRASLKTGELRRAFSLLSLGFARALPRIPGREFEDWLEAKRTGLRRALRDCAAGFWDTSQPAGDWRLAREAAEVLHALDPEPDESTLRKLIEARVMTGHLESAEAALTSHLEALPAGASISEETQQLLERVRTLSARVTSSARIPEAPPPLVGRRTDLEAARGALRRVRGGEFEFLLVKGEAGVGKTRLLDEIRREAHLNGFRCLRARPVELEQKIPLNPLIDALSDPDVGRHVRTLEDPWRAVIASILPELPAGMERPVVPPIDESALSRRLYDAFSILFARLAAEEPTLLFIDDLQWADATTVAVLQFAQRRWRAGALGVVASVRADLVIGGGGVSRYLEGHRELPVTSIELRDLGEADAEHLVDLVAGGRLEETIRRRLCALGGRNPFYVIELTKDLLAGQLRMPDLPTDAITIPISLRQLVDPRIASLSPGAAATAEHLAVWGRWIRVTELSRLTGADPATCVERVEELAQYRLVSMESGRVRIAHELFRGAIYHRMSDARRALHHRRAAEHILTTEQPSVGELAIHYSRAGEAEAAARFGRNAADEALEKGAMAEAAHFLQVVTENVKDRRLRAEATADLAKVLHMSREIARANPLLELAAKRLRETGNSARALRMDIRRVEGLAEVGATPMPDLLDRLASIKAAARDASDWEALALALDSELHLLHRVGEVTAIRQLFSEIRECADVGHPAAACLANASLALNILFGDGREALDRAREAVKMAEELPASDGHVLKAQSRLVLAMIYAGLLGSDEGTDLLRRAAARAESSGDLTLKFYLESNRGVFFMDIGDLEKAETCFERATPLIERTEPGTPHLNLYYNRGELGLQRRAYDEAVHWFRRAERLITPAAPVYLVDLIHSGLGLCSLEMGSLADAREHEAKTTRRMEHWYFDPTTLVTFHSRLLARRGESAKALRVISEVRGALAGRLVLAWIKLVLLEARTAKRLRQPGTAPANEALLVARRLGLSDRAQQLEEIRGALG
jgi:DNA-binding SARP family transcriptional activator/tetratricopeptide (TPR) repeat protein